MVTKITVTTTKTMRRQDGNMTKGSMLTSVGGVQWPLYLQEVRSTLCRGCLKARVVLKPVCAVFFPIHIVRTYDKA